MSVAALYDIHDNLRALRAVQPWAGTGASLVAAGHTHVEFDRRMRERRMVNAEEATAFFERRAGR